MDFDYVINCAKVAKEANVAHVLYVSSERANASSWILYFKVKSQVITWKLVAFFIISHGGVG